MRTLKPPLGSTPNCPFRITNSEALTIITDFLTHPRMRIHASDEPMHATNSKIPMLSRVLYCDRFSVPRYQSKATKGTNP